MSSPSAPDRLDQIQQELASILEERISRLNAALQANEATSRRIVATEMELERAKNTGKRLAAEAARLESEAREFTERREALESQHSQSLQARDEQKAALDELQGFIDDAGAENASSKARLGQLEQQADALRKENEDLNGELQTVEANISQMTALRDEIMHKIRDRSEFVKRMAGGNTE